MRVIEAAWHLFARDGFETTSMSAIAQAAGVPRRTMFRHFAGKVDVALAYQDGIRDELVRRLSLRPASERPLTALVETIIGFLQDMPMDRALALSDLLVRTPELRTHNLLKYAEIEQALAQALTKCEARPTPELDAQIAAAVVVGTWKVANERWLVDRTAGPPILVAKAAFASLSNQFAPLEGYI